MLEASRMGGFTFYVDLFVLPLSHNIILSAYQFD